MSNVLNGKRETEKGSATATHEKLAGAMETRGNFYCRNKELRRFFIHKIIEYEWQFVLNANQSWELS